MKIFSRKRSQIAPQIIKIPAACATKKSSSIHMAAPQTRNPSVVDHTQSQRCSTRVHWGGERWRCCVCYLILLWTCPQDQKPKPPECALVLAGGPPASEESVGR